MGSSAGGAFLPNDPPPSSGQTLTSPTITGGTVSGATITGGSVTSTGSVLTAPTISAPVISGAMTVASGATLTTPTLLYTVSTGTATGATGGAGLALTAVTPQIVAATGASGSAIDLPGGATGPAVGTFYIIQNLGTGALNLYAVGGTINGTTGTTAYPITATGNRTAFATAISATGAWSIRGNT